jgi:hypothetical protein
VVETGCANACIRCLAVIAMRPTLRQHIPLKGKIDPMLKRLILVLAGVSAGTLLLLAMSWSWPDGVYIVHFSHVPAAAASR